MMSTDQPPVSSMILKDLFGVVILFTVALGTGFTINEFRDKSLGLVYESKELRMERAVENLSENSQPKMQVVLSSSVNSDQVAQFLKDKRGFVFDARPEIFYRLGHIPGSASLPRDDFENQYKVFQKPLEADRFQAIIVYCSSNSCEDASLVQKSLSALGFTNVAVFTGGWSEWQEKGLPEESKQ